MNTEVLVERFFETLINGDRPASRQVVKDAEREGYTPRDLVTELFWPTYEMIDRLYRNDQLTCLAHHFGTRLLRQLVDQAAAKLPVATTSARRSVLAFCGPAESEELCAQMAVDLLESGGFSVRFAGGGIPNDEILAQVHETRPDVLLMFGSAPGDLPNIRSLIDTIREIGACDGLQIVVGGGVFNRAEGLAAEIGADLWAAHPLELVDAMLVDPSRRAANDQRTVGRKRRKVA